MTVTNMKGLSKAMVNFCIFPHAVQPEEEWSTSAVRADAAEGRDGEEYICRVPLDSSKMA